MHSNKEAGKRRDIYQDKRILARRGYLCRKLLGVGSFSRVYWVETASGGESYTCKISENEGILEREARILDPVFRLLEGGRQGLPSEGIHSGKQPGGYAGAAGRLFGSKDRRYGSGAGRRPEVSPREGGEIPVSGYQACQYYTVPGWQAQANRPGLCLFAE